ncbi:MAG TPA: hypothetical protein VHG51_18210 [Longimicrobiaceae bacterium]|nr:hypothetical protein [Longimicrobiaceae bacterium]
MTTAVLQFVVQLLTLAFAMVALAVARSRGAMPPVHRAAWTVAGVFFLWRGVPGVLQGLAAFWALLSGAGSEPYELFVRWGPTMNHGRTLVAVATGWTLMALPLLRGRSTSRLAPGLNAACLVLAGTGAYLGWQEGGISLQHVNSLTVLGAVELIGLLAGLLVGVFLSTIDRYLWLALCLFAVQVALDVVWYFATTGFFSSDGWYPPQPVRYLYSTAILSAGCALAWHRLVLARRGARVAGLFDGVGSGIFPSPRPWG